MTIELQAAHLAAALNHSAHALDAPTLRALAALRDAIEPRLAPRRHDPATGLGTRAELQERLLLETVSGSLLVFELDGEPGDEVADVLRGVRAGDVAFRLGEREFALLLPDTALIGARVVGERIADRIASETPLSVRWGAAHSAAGDPRGLYAAAAADLARRPALAAA